MNKKRKQLIDRFQRWFDTNPNPEIMAAECANIAEAYAKNKITPEEHKNRHIELHKHLDELFADFIVHTDRMPDETTISEFIEWSYKETLNPTECQ